MVKTVYFDHRHVHMTSWHMSRDSVKMMSHMPKCVSHPEYQIRWGDFRRWNHQKSYRGKTPGRGGTHPHPGRPKVNLIRITCQAACHGKTEHGIFVKFKKLSKTAVVLIAGVTISGTPCPRHIIVPFGAEASSSHVAQAWAIPPPSWGLLSQWHRQQTTSPETNGASPARTQGHS